MSFAFGTPAPATVVHLASHSDAFCTTVVVAGLVGG